MALQVVEKASLTDVGRQRQSNEDSYLERAPVFAVADGMGGARAGEVASRIAVEAFDQQDESAPPEERLAGVAAFVAYFLTFPLGLGHRASTVVFNPPRGVNSPRIVHHSG